VLAPIIHAHHEWWNGMGYPDRQAGDAIPLGARLLTVVDAYVVMTHPRPYQEAQEHTRALAELRRGAGMQFDPAVVEQFLLLLASIEPSREGVEIA